MKTVSTHVFSRLTGSGWVGLFFVLFLLQMSGQATAQSFTDVSASLPNLPGVSSGAVAWGDYDSDGRLDLIFTGNANGNPVSKLYHNTPSGFVDASTSLPNLPQVGFSSVVWGDYDNDGQLDLFLTGYTGSDRVSKLYHNTPGGFADVTASQFTALPQVSSGAVAWGDYDKDGRLDLFLTGFSSSGVVSKLYRNTGSRFDDTSSELPNLPQVKNSAVAWGDYDNDGRLDLFLTGDTGNGNMSKLYHNTPGGFIDVTASQFTNPPAVDYGSVAWGDYDNDGRLDLFITGGSGLGLYYNTGSRFEKRSSARSLINGSAFWGDYDNDGRLDLIFTGYDGCYFFTILYRNTGEDFEDESGQLPNLPWIRDGSAAWGDYDNDGRLDLILIGSGASKLYHNRGSQANLAPAPPTSLSSSPGVNGRNVRLSWQPPSDDHTPPAGLNYNLYVSDSPQSQNVVGAMADSDKKGYRRVVRLGNSQPSSFTLTGLTPGKTYYWSVQALDAAFAGSEFAPQQSFTTPAFRDVSSQLPNLPQVGFSSVAWGDYDNDGRLDLLITGFTGDYAVNKLYHNTVRGFEDVTASQFTALPGVALSSVAWGDYDNDGRLDLIVTGYTDSDYISKLYRNTGSGFEDVTASQFVALPGVGKGSVAWGDYDNDGRLDLFLTGIGISKLYRNTGSGFEDVTASQFASLPGVASSSVAWGDYDSDGKLDLVLTGSGSASKLYHNTGSDFVDVTENQFAALPGVALSSVAWGDYDNDGRLDLILTGISDNGPVSKLYHNTGSGFEDKSDVLLGLPGVSSGAVAWGDYDNDGRLDLIITGGTESGNVSKLYRNFSPKANAVPDAPTSLASSPGPDGRSVSLSWQPPIKEDETPPTGLSYNLYVSDQPQSQTVVGAMADLNRGYRRVVRLGNSQPTSFSLTGLNSGQSYYWSVQALDASFTGSEFAKQQRFTTCLPLVITQQPVSGSAVCEGAVVTATVSVSGTGPFTYQWYQDGTPVTNNSSASTATLSLPQVTTASAGAYVVAIGSGCGSLTSTAFSLTVNAPPTPSLLSSGTLNCTTTSVTLTAGGGATYLFTGPAGPLVSSGNTVVVSQPGSYSVSVSSVSGCQSTTSITVEQDLTLPTPSLVASATATTNQPISVTAQGCSGQLTWQLLGGSGQDQGSVYTLSQPGSYSLSATCSVGGCTSPAASLSLSIQTPTGFQLLAPTYDCATGAILRLSASAFP